MQSRCRTAGAGPWSALLAAGPTGWAIPSNYPELGDGKILRLDWFILFFQFITAVIVAIVASLGAIPQVHCHAQHHALAPSV